MGISSPRRDCRAYVWLQARSSLAAWSQAAPEQGTYVTHACQSYYQHLGCCGREWLRPPGVGSFDFDRRNSWSLSFTSVLAMAPVG